MARFRRRTAPGGWAAARPELRVGDDGAIAIHAADDFRAMLSTVLPG